MEKCIKLFDHCHSPFGLLKGLDDGSRFTKRERLVKGGKAKFCERFMDLTFGSSLHGMVIVGMGNFGLGNDLSCFRSSIRTLYFNLFHFLKIGNTSDLNKVFKHM